MTRDEGRGRLERIDVICTGGRYNDPERGLTPRHARQKLGRLNVHRRGDREGRLAELFTRGKPKVCPRCARRVPVGGAYPVFDESVEDMPLERIEGGVWQRILEHIETEQPDRRVVTVDISDVRYPW